MHAVILLTMIACGFVGMLNGFRRVTAGFGVRVSAHGHVAPLGVAFFSVLAAIAYHVTWAMSGTPGLVTLIGLCVAVLCVAATITLLFYDPALPRKRPPVRKKA